MPCTSPDFHQKSFRINDKFLTRLLSKETSKSHPSFRVYYGDVSSAVPFTWETRPGTPKHPSCPHSDIPPLTPPPSYYANSTNLKTSSRNQTIRSKLLLHTLIRRMNPKNPSLSSSSSFSSLSWSSSSRSLVSDPMMTTPTPCGNKRRRFASWGSYFDRGDRHLDHQDHFHPSKENGDRPPPLRLHGGSYSMMIIKKAFLSIIGRGSS